MADCRPFKYVKFRKPQEAHMSTLLKDVCVQYERNPLMGFPDHPRKRMRPDIRHNKDKYSRWSAI